jgi:hypothetical protein
MKLIKEGYKLHKIYRATCRHCGAVWECEEPELEIVFCRNERAIQSTDCGHCGKYGLSFEEFVDVE